MRTTVDIDDRVYAQLKKQAVSEHTTVKALLHNAARRIVDEGQTGNKGGDRERKPWPTVGSVDSPAIEPVDNDFALFGYLDDEEL